MRPLQSDRLLPAEELCTDFVVPLILLLKIVEILHKFTFRLFTTELPRKNKVGTRKPPTKPLMTLLSGFLQVPGYA